MGRRLEMTNRHDVQQSRRAKRSLYTNTCGSAQARDAAVLLPACIVDASRSHLVVPKWDIKKADEWRLAALESGHEAARMLWAAVTAGGSQSATSRVPST